MTSKIAFLTCHQKQVAVSDPLKSLGFEVEVCDAFNTDELGTFTNEIPRHLSQQQAALKKAQLACELTQANFGLGSEGSFGPHPQVHLLPWNYEVLALWDAQHQHAVYAVHGTAETNYSSQRVTSVEEAFSFARLAQFPSHALIMGSPADTYFQKGIQDESAFVKQLATALQSDASVWLETDMRAHMNPTRMNAIAQTALKLQQLLKSSCPQCHLLGYGPTRLIPGALCNFCNCATRLPKGEHWECASCHFQEDKVVDTTVSAANCDYCNP